MTIYAICYDLNKVGQNYSGLIDAIKKFSAWWHHLDSTWLVDSEASAEAIRDYLKQEIDPNDELLVVALPTGNASWIGFSSQGSEWLRDNLG